MKAIKRLLSVIAIAGTMVVQAAVYEMNVDWKFSKLNFGHGLDAALSANLQDGKNIFDLDYDDSKWETVSLPHSINAHDTYDGHAVDQGEVDIYRGWMAYRKKVTLPKGKHCFLEFETVRTSIYLYVNGKLAGYYEAGIVPSGYEITEFLQPGENLICVVSENTAGRGTKEVSAESKDKPGDWAGEGFQWNGMDFNPVQGGLTGNVRLHVKSTDNYITLPLYEKLQTKGVYVWYDGEVHVEAEIHGSGDISWEVLGLQGAIKEWSPDTPYLYDVKVQLKVGGKVEDEVIVRTGFRTVAYDKDKGILINGKPTWMPGYAQRSTASWAAIGIPPQWLYDWEMDLVRESKANFIRWMHVAPKPAPVRACDKAGVINVCPAGDKESEPKGRHWEQRVEAMRDAIIYFRNSPSILFWEAGNNQISGAHMKEMRELKEKLDPHGGRFMGCRTINSPEQVAEAEYVGTMIHRHDMKAYESMTKLNKFMPMMETEYCREECARRVWDRFTPPDYNFNCVRLSSGAKQRGYNCYDMTQEEMALSNTNPSDGYSYFYGNRAGGKGFGFYSACAMLCWTDCNQHGRQSNTENCRSSGRVDALRIPKENFYVHQCMYSTTPQVKVLGHWNYPKKTSENYWYNEKVDDGKELKYCGERKQRDPEHKTVYIAGSLQCASVELLVNGKSKGVKDTPEKGLFVFAFENVDVTESGYVEAIARDKEGKVIARDKVETVGEAAKMVLSAKVSPEGFVANGSDLAMIDLKLVDASGRVLPLANDRIDFTLKGEAKFMGGWVSGTFGETSPVGKNWTRFENGLARVFVKSGRTPGKVVLTAKCGKFTESIELNEVAYTAPDLKPVNAAQGVMLAKDYTVQNPVAPVRDLEAKAGAIKYKVFVNGKEVAFGRNLPFKPDESTGVCAPYEPVLKAIKASGGKFEYEASPKVRKAMRKFSSTPYAPSITLKVGKRTLDVIAGLTVIFEDNGKDKNLTNFEFTGDKKTPLTGELAAILGYIPDLSVKTDDTQRTFNITVK